MKRKKRLYLPLITFVLVVLSAIGCSDDDRVTTPQLNERDSLALMKIYETIHADEWPDGIWEKSKPIRDWQNLSVGFINGEYRIVGMALCCATFIDSHIPEEITWLTELRVLRIETRDVSGKMPAYLGNLPNLLQLVIAFTHYANISSEIGKLSTLQELYLIQNPKMNGGLPEEIAELKNLRVLDLLECERLGGTIPKKLANLKELEYLRLKGSALEGRLPVGIGSLSKLTQVNMVNNKLSGELPKDLGNLPLANWDMHILLSNNMFVGSIPKEYASFGPRRIGLSLNQLSGIIPEEVIIAQGDELKRVVFPQKEGYGFDNLPD